MNPQRPQHTPEPRQPVRAKQVVVRNRSNPTVSRKRVVAKPQPTNQPRKAFRKPEQTRIGKPDFARSIVSQDTRGSTLKKRPASRAQRLFFDAAIAVVTVAFAAIAFIRF